MNKRLKEKESRDKCRNKKKEMKEETAKKIQNLTKDNEDLRNKMVGYQQRAKLVQQIFNAHETSGKVTNEKFQKGKNLLSKFNFK